MVKILKRGVIPGTVPIKTDCRNCRSQLEFMPNEARVLFDQRDGDAYKIECPVCTAIVWTQK